VGARAGLAKEIKRGRRAVDVLDTIVKAAFRDDSNVLAEWRSAKRIRALPSGTNARSESNSDGGSGGTPVVTPVSAAAAA
jgi:hypothetical protein